MNTYGKLLKTAIVAALFVVVGASWAAAPWKPVATGPASNGTLVRLPGNRANVGGGTYLQAHDGNSVLNLTLALRLQNQAQLQAFLQDVQDPHSSQYRHFLTNAQITRLYGPTKAQVNAVTTYLASQGIQVVDVSRDRLLVHASASTATVEHAFGVNIGDYNLNGSTVYAADDNPRLRADIAPLVVAVMGLENAVVLEPHLRAAPSTAPPPATIAGGIGPSGFSPPQLATAYGWPLGLAVGQANQLTDTTLASGVTLAIATAFTYRASDVQTFWSAYKLPSHTLTNVAVDGVTRRLNDETTLDIEHSSAMAPGANIMVYSGINPQFSTFVDVFDQIEDDNLADVVSTSWGSCEPGTPPADIVAEDQIFTLMIGQGQTLFAAAGDGGSQDRCTAISAGQGGDLTASGTDNADFPSSDPLVGAAGGTRLVLNSSNAVTSESAWTSGGGGDSVLFAEPTYESAAGLTANTSCVTPPTGAGALTGGSTPCAAAGNASRESSDLSMVADPGTPYSMFYNGRWVNGFGGTSFVAPELTGLWAIAVKAYRVAQSSATKRLGAAPAAIYPAANTGCTRAFRDITTGSNGSFSAGTGWDHPTGWGAPVAGELVTYLGTATCP